MKLIKKRGKPGRPPHDVSEAVFAWFSTGLTDGATVSEVARQGLEVYANGKDAKPIRRFRGKHLEWAYRASSRDRVVPWLRPEAGPGHAWPTFMGRPLPVPFGGAIPSERKPGRPKK